MRHALLILIFTTGFAANAGSIKETCTKWMIEPAIYECSNGQSYAHGDAECSTADWRAIPLNTTHGPKPKLIFCGHRKMDKPQVCVDDSARDTEKCLAEFMKKMKDTVAENKPASVVHQPAEATK